MASACLFLLLSGMSAEFVVVAVIIKAQIVSDSYNGMQSCIWQTFHLHHHVSIPPSRVMLSGLWTMESIDTCHFQPMLGKASTQLSSSPSLKATADKTSCWYGRAVRSLQSQLMGPGYLNISSNLCMVFARQEWVVISFSRVSSWGRDQIHGSCIGRQILYLWATREAQVIKYE